MKIKRAILVFILVFFTATQVNAWTIENTELAIIRSGQTSVLSMEMAKLYGIQVLKDYPGEKKRIAQKDLMKAKRTMGGIYKALLAFEPVATNAELVKIVKAAELRWYQMKKMLSTPPSKTGFLDVLDASDTLLDNNEMMTSYMESLSPVPISEILRMASRQQMYVMKLLRDYLAASMGIDKEYRIDLMVNAAIEFQSAMLIMASASKNTGKTKGLIKSISKMEWQKVYKTVTECIESNGTTFNVFMMMAFCDTLLEKVNRLVSIHAKSGNASYDEAIDRIDDEATTNKDIIDDEATTTKDKNKSPFSSRR